jgi:predicted TPR repeat methyltransferase
MEQITPQFSLDKDEIIGTGTGLEGKETEARIRTGTGIYIVKRMRL